MENKNNKPNPFIGTWETNVNTSDHLPPKMIFTDDELTCYDKNGDIFSTVGVMPHPLPDVTVTWAGTYDYTDTKLSIHHAPPSVINLEYEFKNNILYLASCPYNKK